MQFGTHVLGEPQSICAGQSLLDLHAMIAWTTPAEPPHTAVSDTHVSLSLEDRQISPAGQVAPVHPGAVVIE